MMNFSGKWPEMEDSLVVMIEYEVVKSTGLQSCLSQDLPADIEIKTLVVGTPLNAVRFIFNVQFPPESAARQHHWLPCRGFLSGNQFSSEDLARISTLGRLAVMRTARSSWNMSHCASLLTRYREHLSYSLSRLDLATGVSSGRQR
jgi:hypothetical protein